MVAGPILAIIAVEHGPAFAAAAAGAALAALFASVTFAVAYAHASRRATWPGALSLAFAAWLAAGWLVTQAPASLALSLLIGAGALVAAPHAFPKAMPERMAGGRTSARAELGLRMLAGALLTLGATAATELLGPRWGGLLALFPVLTIVLAVSSHRAHGAEYAVLLLRAMTTGMYSLAAFCLVLGMALPVVGTAGSFALAVAATMAALAATRRLARAL
jgi:hypothetical protein